jgi:hypothetical protein
MTIAKISPLPHAEEGELPAARPGAWQGRGEIFATGGVTLRDVTRRHRFGCKGARAPAFLQDLGVAVPEHFNHWAVMPDGLLVARLAATEFFLESAPPALSHETLLPAPDLPHRSATLAPDPHRSASPAPDPHRSASLAPDLPQRSAPPLPLAHRVQEALAEARAAARPGIYPVLREDAAFEIDGPLANDLLVQVCNVDFRPVVAASTPAGGALVMTSVAGVAVLAVPLSCPASRAMSAPAPPVAGGIALRIWCDPTLGRWLWATLQQIAGELGDGVIEPNGGWT